MVPFLVRGWSGLTVSVEKYAIFKQYLVSQQPQDTSSRNKNKIDLFSFNEVTKTNFIPNSVRKLKKRKPLVA